MWSSGLGGRPRVPASTRRNRSRRLSFSREKSFSSSLEFRAYDRVTESEIEALFSRHAALDKREIRAFLAGRFKLEDRWVKVLFDKYDRNRNRTLEKDEFRAMVADLNSCLDTFNEQEAEFYADHLLGIYWGLALTYGCCLCTVFVTFALFNGLLTVHM